MNIERFTIADVAAMYGIYPIRERGGESYAVCPFCGDKRGKFSFVVAKGKKRNCFKCWKCGEGGDAVELHMKLSGKNYSGEDGYKAATRDIFKAINGDADLAEYHKKVEEKTKETPVEAEKESDEVCSRTYYALLKLLTLDERHKADLLKRGLTEDDIKRFRFKSLPSSPNGICRKLMKAGYTLKGVPGFYRDRKGLWTLALPGNKGEDGKWHPDTGFFCPVFDGERNLILGFQIRLDVPRHDNKYIWLSSVGRMSGVSSGTISTYLPGEDSSVVIVTEGILKATVVYSLLKGSVSVIGIPGVKSIRSAECYLERHKGTATAFEAYDMDKAIRIDDKTDAKTVEKTQGILADAENLVALISAYDIGVERIKWDMDPEGFWKGEFKGLDDFLAAYEKRDLFLSFLKQKASAKAQAKALLQRVS